MTFIQPDPDAAAEAARKEAEAAHVTPGAVMYSAPEGYATGAGEKFAPGQIDPDDPENNRSIIAPVADSLQSGDIETFNARTFGDQEGRAGPGEDAYVKADTSATAEAPSSDRADAESDAKTDTSAKAERDSEPRSERTTPRPTGKGKSGS